jgi:hypothetical protein
MRLIFKSDSIQNLGNIFNISRLTIRNCVESGSLFLNRFIFSVEPVTEGYVEGLLSVDALAKMIEESRSSYRSEYQKFQSSEAQPNRRIILASNVVTPDLTKEYPSVIKTAAAFNCSPGTILNYLRGPSSGRLFLSQWKFTEIKK